MQAAEIKRQFPDYRDESVEAIAAGIANGEIFCHPQETWNEAKCAKLARRYARDGLGTKYPFPGYLGSSASIPPKYGEIRYNGGCSHDGKWYQGEFFPLPIIPDTYEIIVVRTWGWRLVRKAPAK